MLQWSVKNKLPVETVAEHEGLRRNLAELREALLRLHKALLESERAGYEQAFGKIASPYQFLQLLTSDAWFAWLHPVSQHIAAMDEMLEAKEPLTTAGVRALADRAKALLVASSAGDGFAGHYDAALQRDPDVVLAHAEAARCLRTVVF